MKFSVLYKDHPEVIQYAASHVGKKYGNGASLVALRRLGIWDNTIWKENVSDSGKSALAFCCEGPVWSYLWHKLYFEHIYHACSVVKGWF